MSKEASKLTPRGLERRLKRHLRSQPHSFFAPCAPAFETVLRAELLVLPDVSIEALERGGVAFSGPLDTLYHANLKLRSAHRVLLRIDDFLAQVYPMLFDHARHVPWEHYLGFNTKVSFKVSAKESRLRHKDNIASTLYSALLARLEPLGLRPELSEDAATEIHVRLYQDRCTLSLNTSGEHLHKRGYRTHVSTAPLRETLAASILLAQPLATYPLIVDPMCGAGTLLIEAALIATGRAAGLNRAFAFEAFPFFQASKWKRFKAEARAEEVETDITFLGSDVNVEAISNARANAARAGVAEIIQFEVRDALALELPESSHSLVVSNVPYGERLGSAATVRKLLSEFSSRLATLNTDFAFITHASDWLEHPNLRISDRLSFHNGGLAVQLTSGKTKAAPQSY